MSMMRHVRVFRVDGSSLSCCFSPEGSLSSALLCIEDTQQDATSQLPGLTTENAIGYLTELGYSTSHRPDCIRCGRIINERLRGSPLFVETVRVESSHIIFSVALLTDQVQACCRRAFVALQDRRDRSLSFTAVRNPELREEFRTRFLQLVS